MKIFYRFLSIILHPLLIPLYTTIIFLYIFSELIPYNIKYAITKVILIGSLTLPLLTGVLLYLFKLLRSYEMKNKSERVIPILSTGIYFSVTAKLLGSIHYGGDLSSYMIALVISLSTIIFMMRNANTSLHSTALSSLIGFAFFIGLKYDINTIYLLIPGFLILGLLSTGRIFLKNHSAREIYLGIIFGFIPQILIMFLD
jgi:hypothetical protein